MIILVAVTLSIALGENGLIAKAKETRTKQEEQTIYEDIQGMVELNNNGEIEVDKTVDNVKAKYPGTELSGTTLTVPGKYGTYLYKIDKVNIKQNNNNSSIDEKEEIRELIEKAMLYGNEEAEKKLDEYKEKGNNLLMGLDLEKDNKMSMLYKTSEDIYIFFADIQNQKILNLNEEYSDFKDYFDTEEKFKNFYNENQVLKQIYIKLCDTIGKHLNELKSSEDDSGIWMVTIEDIPQFNSSLIGQIETSSEETKVDFGKIKFENYGMSFAIELKIDNYTEDDSGISGTIREIYLNG